MIGQIEADFLDINEADDIATSSRQRINEDDSRYQELQKHIYLILKKIQSQWTNYRNEVNLKYAVDNAKTVHPALEKWYNSLNTDVRKDYAKKLFSTIEILSF